MCGRFALTSAGEVLAEFFELPEVPEVSPRYNIAPTQPVPVVRFDRDQQARRFDLLHWGLVPSWAKDPGIGSRMINARAETAADKPAYRSAIRYRRCLVIADGFYEWQKLAGQKRKQPHYIRMGDGQPFAFAALWEHWAGPDGSALESCALLTTTPNDVVRPLHDRMPVILRPGDYSLWLDPSLQDPGQVQSLLAPYPADEMTALPVNMTVNNPSHYTPACIAPVNGVT